MSKTTDLAQQLDEIGGELLDGSGFEEEKPDPIDHTADDDEPDRRDRRSKKNRKEHRNAH